MELMERVPVRVTWRRMGFREGKEAQVTPEILEGLLDEKPRPELSHKRTPVRMPDVKLGNRRATLRPLGLSTRMSKS